MFLTFFFLHSVAATNPILSWDLDSGLWLNPSIVCQVLAGSGVVHQHANQALIGPSRVEQHISACAAKDVEDGPTAGHLPAALCDMLQPTQATTPPDRNPFKMSFNVFSNLFYSTLL